MAKYLDGAGLGTLWGQIKSTFYSKSGGAIGGDVSLVYGTTGSDQMIRFSAAGSEPQSVYLGIRRPVASYGPSYKDTAGNWYKLLHEGNYTSFTVKKDGTGATGTWGISISGNAATATSAGLLDGAGLMTQVSDWDTASLSIFKSSENSASNLPSGAGFLYGTTLRFHRDTNLYYTDLAVDLYNDKLFFRRHTESGWGNWQQIIHSANIGSQSVSYATSAGSAGSSTSLDPESLSDLNSGTKWRFFRTSGSGSSNKPTSATSWYNGITFASNNSNSYKQQLAIGLDNPHMYFRNMKNDGSGTWNSWTTVLDSGNYTSYTVQKDGTGASGIWSISIYGNAATATSTDKLYMYNSQRGTLDSTKGLHDGSVRYIIQGSGIRGLHFSWDSGYYDTQIYIPEHRYDSTDHLKWRSNGEDGTWESWMTILDSSNYTTYAETAGTCLKLTGGTISGTTSSLLTINSSDNDNYITFKRSGTIKGYVGWENNTGVFMQAGSRYIHVTDAGDLKFYDSSSDRVVLHSGNYTSYCATSSHNHDGTYLKLSSASSQQAITGPVCIKDDLGGNLASWVTYQHRGPLEVGRSSNAMTVAIGVTDDNYGYIQTKGNNITTPGDLVLLPGGGNLYYDLSKKPILHSGNYSSYALPKTGGTLSNTVPNILTLKRTDTGGGAFIDYYHAGQTTHYWRGGSNQTGVFAFYYDGSTETLSLTSSAITYKGNTIWHAGNDGSGSGLDADTVDGKHYSDIILSNGKNLVRNYNVETTSSSYMVWSTHVMTETVADGDKVTITIEYSLASGATKTWLRVYTGGGYADIATFDATPGLDHHTQSVTTTVHYSIGHNDNGVCLYYGDSSKSGTCTVYRVKVERGDHFTGWSPAPEDLITAMNIGSQSVSYATSAGTASAATNVSWTGITSVIQAGNEVNMADYGFAATDLWFNYKPRDSRNNNSTLLSNYYFGNLGTGVSNVVAAGFKKSDSSDSYVLLAGGGDKAVSDFATSGHNHDTVYVKKSGDTLTGPLVFQRSEGTNNYNEGIRFNLSGPNNWAGFTIGGTATSGTGDGIWAFLVNNKTLYISHNGSHSSTYGLSFTNAGALNLKTSSLTNNGNTIITSANIGSQTVAVAGKLGNYSPAFNKLFATSKSVTMTTVQTYWYVKIELSGYAQPYQIGLTCSYNNEVDRGILEFSGMSSGYIYRNCCQNSGNIKGLCMKTNYDASEHLWIFWVKFDKILDTGHYSPSSQATCTVYLDNANSAFNVTATTTEPSGVTWISTGETDSNILIKNCTIYGTLSGNATSATTADSASSVPTLTNSEIDAICT